MANAREQAKARVKEVLECETVMVEFSDSTCERAAEAIVSGLERLVEEQEGFHRPEPPMPGQTTIDEMLDNDA